MPPNYLHLGEYCQFDRENRIHILGIDNDRNELVIEWSRVGGQSCRHRFPIPDNGDEKEITLFYNVYQIDWNKYGRVRGLKKIREVKSSGEYIEGIKDRANIN